MPTAVTITGVYEQQGGVLVTGKIKLSGSYTTAVGGDTVNFATATQDPLFLGMASYIPSSQPPMNLDIWSQGGQFVDGYVASIGTTPANCKVIIITALNSELGSGAYSAGLLADNIAFMAVFPRV